MEPSSDPAGRWPRWAAAFLLVALLALAWWLAGWTGDASSRGPGLLWVLLTSSPFALLWIASAFGLGWAVLRLLMPAARGRPALEAAVGVACLLVADAALGRLGLMQIGGRTTAWLLLAPGLVLAVLRLGRTSTSSEVARRPDPLTWCALPAIAVLLVASCSAPGWLWGTEFGGYDALSYHLQLPKEWHAAGRIAPPEHNVYSHLPGFAEAAFYHLACLDPSGLRWAYAAQMLHAGITILTATMLASVVARLAGRLPAAVAFVLLVGTPWPIVVGTLAYNEMFAVLMLAAALGVCFDRELRGIRAGIVLGILLAAACGAKLTAAGLVALPVLIVLLIERSPRDLARLSLGAVVSAVIVLSLWLLGNLVDTGNPVFPFAARWFGSGHWTAEQVAIWNAGHAPTGSMFDRAAALWNQLLRYGIGPSPDPTEPWRPHWSILPWLMLAGALFGCMSLRWRQTTTALLVAVVVQAGFWLLFTHLKSRFLLPVIAPAVMLAALPAARLGTAALWRFILAIGLIAYAAVPVVVFAGEKAGRPAAAVDGIRFFTGEALRSQYEQASIPERAELRGTSGPAFWLNGLLADDARVLCIGEAAVFYYDLGRIDYTTVWDRGVASEALRLTDAEAAGLLRDRGYTHVLVNALMLDIWEEARWNDPAITSDRVLAFATSNLQLERDFGGGLLLFRVPVATTESTDGA